MLCHAVPCCAVLRRAVLCCAVLPQAVLVPAAVSGLAADVYLGIVHTEVDRKYENYLYQMEVRVCLLAIHVCRLLVLWVLVGVLEPNKRRGSAANKCVCN